MRSMETRVTLVDLLDRVLDKGLVVQADVIISVAGIPLIAVNLRATIAGMQTMLEHGCLTAWDQALREEALPVRPSRANHAPGAIQDNARATAIAAS